MKDVDASAVSWGLIIANCLSFFGSVNFGFALAWTAASLQNIANDESMPNFSQREQNWVSAMLTMGAMVGTFVGAFMSQRFGTYIVLVLTIFPASSGWASILFAQGISALIVGRALVGVCLGLFKTSTLAFVAEITPPRFRGFTGGLYQIGRFFGIFLCLMISPYVSWRSLTAVALVISCIMSCGLIFMKKTCESLMKDNKILVHEQVLKSLSDSFNENEVVTGKSDDTTSMEKPSDNQSIWAALKKPEVYKPFILCSTMALGFQFSAVSVILFYNIKMFTNTGLSEDMAYVGSQCIGVTQLVLGIAGSFLALKLPRRPLFFFTAFLVTLGLASVGVCCLLARKQTNSEVMGVAVICSFVFTQATFAVGYGTIVWAYIGEILPRDFEGLTIGSASLVNWVVCFFLTFFYHQMVELLNDEGVFFCFTFLFLFTTCLLVPWLPETKGKSLREIQAEFNSNTKSKHSEKARLIADRKVPTNKMGYEIIPGKD